MSSETIGDTNGASSLYRPSHESMLASFKLERAKGHIVAAQEMISDFTEEALRQERVLASARLEDARNQVYRPLHKLEMARDWWNDNNTMTPDPLTDDQYDLVIEVQRAFEAAKTVLPSFDYDTESAIRALLWHHREALALEAEYKPSRISEDDGEYDYSKLVTAMQKANADALDPTPHCAICKAQMPANCNCPPIVAGE